MRTNVYCSSFKDHIAYFRIPVNLKTFLVSQLFGQEGSVQVSLFNFFFKLVVVPFCVVTFLSKVIVRRFVLHFASEVVLHVFYSITVLFLFTSLFRVFSELELNFGNYAASAKLNKKLLSSH